MNCEQWLRKLTSWEISDFCPILAALRRRIRKSENLRVLADRHPAQIATNPTKGGQKVPPELFLFALLLPRPGLRKIGGNAQITACRRGPQSAGKLSPRRGSEREATLRHPNLDVPFRAFPDKADDLDRIQIHPFVGKSAWYFWAARFQVLATIDLIGSLGKLGFLGKPQH